MSSSFRKCLDARNGPRVINALLTPTITTGTVHRQLFNVLPINGVVYNSRNTINDTPLVKVSPMNTSPASPSIIPSVPRVLKEKKERRNPIIFNDILLMHKAALLCKHIMYSTIVVSKVTTSVFSKMATTAVNAKAVNKENCEKVLSSHSMPIACSLAYTVNMLLYDCRRIFGSNTVTIYTKPIIIHVTPATPSRYLQLKHLLVPRDGRHYSDPPPYI